MARENAIAILVLGGLAALLYSRSSSAAWSENGSSSFAPGEPAPSSPATIDDGFTYDEISAQASSAEVFAPPLETWGGDLMTAPAIGDSFRTNDYRLYAQAIAAAEAAYGIPQDLLARLLYKESRYRPDIIDGTVRSSTGAAGIAQFMPATAQQYGLMVGGIDGRLDPKRAIPAAARYLKALWNMFRDWTNAVAAYNWGPGNMQHYLAGDIDRRTGRPYEMPAETVDYIAAIAPSGTIV